MMVIQYGIRYWFDSLEASETHVPVLHLQGYRYSLTIYGNSRNTRQFHESEIISIFHSRKLLLINMVLSCNKTIFEFTILIIGILHYAAIVKGYSMLLRQTLFRTKKLSLSCTSQNMHSISHMPRFLLLFAFVQQGKHTKLDAMEIP